MDRKLYPQYLDLSIACLINCYFEDETKYQNTEIEQYMINVVNYAGTNPEVMKYLSSTAVLRITGANK